MPPRPWANKPWELLTLPSKPVGRTPSAALKIGTEMAQVHNAILRGLNTIYLQAPSLNTTTEKSNPLFLTRSWATWVTDHHHLEEDKMFPGFEKVTGVPGLMRKDVEQHHAFEEQLEGLLRYASEKEGQGFEGSTLRGLIEGLVEGGFTRHLEGEIESLLSLGEFTNGEDGSEKGKAMLRVYKECEDEAAGQDKICPASPN